MFMCTRHWRLLPKPLKNAIWETYVPGQETRKDPSFEYVQAAGVAIRWLSEYEGLREPGNDTRDRGDGHGDDTYQ